MQVKYKQLGGHLLNSGNREVKESNLNGGSSRVMKQNLVNSTLVL